MVKLIRNIFKRPMLSSAIRLITKGKSTNSFWVKLLPQNSDFQKNTFRMITADGIKFKLDMSEWMEWVLYFGIDAEKKNSLYQLVQQGSIIIDAGSNFGETLLMFAKLTGPQGSAVGFEPVPYVYEKCIQNISLNSFTNCKVENKGLSNVNELLSINDPENNNSGGIFLTRNNSGPKVNAVRLDDYAVENNLNKIDLIKIDVEGFEFNVLKGAAGILKKFKPVLFIELIDSNLRKQNASSFEVIKFLRQFNYSSFIDNRTGFEIKSDPSMQLSTDIICR